MRISGAGRLWIRSTMAMRGPLHQTALQIDRKVIAQQHRLRSIQILAVGWKETKRSW
jgi:hypothetical protein